ncbi:MAG: MBL fold metallo-hydrolase, partial [Spirochaetes bacterium]
RPRDRNEAVHNACIIITTAGMMNGGPVSFYMKKLHNKENCSLVTTGYMVEGTVGRTLMDTGRYIADGLDVRPKMHMEFLDLSAHTDHDHIVRFLEKLSPEKIFLVHGEHNPEFEKELKSMGFDAYSPEIGEKMRV